MVTTICTSLLILQRLEKLWLVCAVYATARRAPHGVGEEDDDLGVAAMDDYSPVR